MGMRMFFYRLNDDVEAVLCEEFTLDRSHNITTKIGNYLVSTVFLSMDHNCTGEGGPLVWETAIFGPGDEDYWGRCNIFARYSTYEEAKAGHDRACEEINN